MKALTALKAADPAEYARAIQGLAAVRQAPAPADPPQRGEQVVWQGETYRLNQRAADDLLIAYNRLRQEPGAPAHLHLVGAGRKMLLILEPMPTPAEPAPDPPPCPSGHPGQARALLVKKQKPRRCQRCGSLPILLPVAQNAEPTAAGWFAEPEDLPEPWPEPVRQTLAARAQDQTNVLATHLLNKIQGAGNPHA